MTAVGDKVTFRNGEICTVKEIRNYKGGYKTCGTNFQTRTIKAYTTFVIEFDDGETTVASQEEITN